MMKDDYSSSMVYLQKFKEKICTLRPIQFPPYIELEYKGGKVKFDGLLGRVWNILQQRLGFTSQYINEDYKSGIVRSGEGNRDVIMHPIVMTPAYIDKVDYTYPILNSWYALYIKDSDEANSSQSYIRNWSIGLWTSTALMVIIFTLVLYLMLNIKFKIFYKNITTACKTEDAWGKKSLRCYKLKNLNEGSLGNCFIIALAAFCSQGCNLSIHLTSIRILLLNLFIFGMIMCNSYSALLVSQLTLRERFLPFNTLDEIPSKASQYSLCVRKNSYAYDYFKVNSTTTALRRTWAKIVNRKPCVQGLIPADVMCAPQIAFLETPAIMQGSISKNFKCKITNLKGKYQKIQFSILLFKGFNKDMKHALNSEIIRYRELGILAHLIKKYLRQDNLLSPADDPLLQVTYDHIEGVLMVYSCLAGVSFIFLFAEIIVNQFSRNLLGRKRRKINIVSTTFKSGNKILGMRTAQFTFRL